MGFTLTKSFVSDSFVAAVYAAYIIQNEIKPFLAYEKETEHLPVAAPFALVGAGLPKNYDLTPYVEKFKTERSVRDERILVNNMRAFFSSWCNRACAIGQDNNDGYKHYALEAIAYCYDYGRQCSQNFLDPIFDMTSDYVSMELYNPVVNDLGSTIFTTAEDYPAAVMAHSEMFSTEYEELPWKEELPNIEGHMARISKKFPGQVSYYETPERMAIGRRLCTKAGRYLTKFYPDMDKDRIRHWAAQASNFFTLQFADTGADIKAVYQRGPNSCMCHEDDYYESSQHPVLAYESPDLKLAYIGSDHKVTARALVWPEKKTVGRVYGDWDRLVTLLKEAGYNLKDEKRPNDHYDTFNGARLKYIPEDDDEEHIVCPYIDNSNYAYYDGEYLVIGTAPDDKDYKTYTTQSDSGYGTITDHQWVADLDEQRSTNWVNRNCVWSEYYGEYVHERHEFVTRIYARYSELLENNDYIGDHRTEDMDVWYCELDERYYINVDYTVVGEYKIPTLYLERYKKEYNLDIESEYNPQENVA